MKVFCGWSGGADIDALNTAERSRIGLPNRQQSHSSRTEAFRGWSGGADIDAINLTERFQISLLSRERPSRMTGAG